MSRNKALILLSLPVAFVLALLNATIWHAYMYPPPPRLHVSVLDVGQGDAILVEGPTGITMLVDGGPDNAVLRELPLSIRYLRRSIDMVVETHPDKDHIQGLIGVFDRFRITYFMNPGIPGSTDVASGLDDAVNHEPGLTTFLARTGMRIHLGGGAYADVVYPDKDVSRGETNAGSVVLHVVYGKTSFMLTGDLPSAEEDYLIARDGDSLESTVLKAGHHGSKNSTDDAWLAHVKPSIVAISAGKNNRYGHPNPETLDRIRNEGAEILSTVDRGTIRFESNGETVIVK